MYGRGWGGAEGGACNIRPEFSESDSLIFFQFIMPNFGVWTKRKKDSPVDTSGRDVSLLHLTIWRSHPTTTAYTKIMQVVGRLVVRASGGVRVYVGWVGREAYLDHPCAQMRLCKEFPGKNALPEFKIKDKGGTHRTWTPPRTSCSSREVLCQSHPACACPRRPRLGFRQARVSRR